MKVLTLTTLFPNQQQPVHGVFVKNRVIAFKRFCEVKVVAPVPWVPSYGLVNKRYQPFARVPYKEIQDEIEVFHPRYLVTPKLGRSLYGIIYCLSIVKFMKDLRKKFDFDLLDVHWAYPDGFAGVLLGKLFKKPVTVTLRGTDLNHYPDFFLRRKMIIYALKNSDKNIFVCNALQKRANELGINGSKNITIANGVDIKKFNPMEKRYARDRLGLPDNKKIVLSVGHLVERKGFHHIIDGVNKLIAGTDNKQILLVIIGEGEYRKVLEKQIERLGMDSFVYLMGSRLNEELVYWYNAADVFCLASSSEGWPNVIFESLACGTPVIATLTGGIPEVLCSDEYGILVKEQRGDDFALAISEALRKNWNKERIVTYARENTWEKVGEMVYREFESVLNLQ